MFNHVFLRQSVSLPDCLFEYIWISSYMKYHTISRRAEQALSYLLFCWSGTNSTVVYPSDRMVMNPQGFARYVPIGYLRLIAYITIPVVLYSYIQTIPQRRTYVSIYLSIYLSVYLSIVLSLYIYIYIYEFIVQKGTLQRPHFYGVLKNSHCMIYMYIFIICFTYAHLYIYIIYYIYIYIIYILYICIYIYIYTCIQP